MTTSAVSQPPIATAEVANASRNSGRKGGAGSDGGDFSGLLDKISTTSNRGDRQTGPANEASPGSSNGGHLGDLASDDVIAEDLHAASREPAVEQADSSASNTSQVDVNMLLQALNGNGALVDANAQAAVAGRLPGSATAEAEAAMIKAALAAQKDGDTLSPEQLILASLQRTGGQNEEPQSGDVRPPIAHLTIMGRETHLAPVSEGTVEWAARLAQEGVPALRAQAQSGNAGEAELTQTSVSDATAEDAQIANPRTAVTAVRDGQLGTAWQQGGSDQGADAQPGSGEQVMAVQRSDAFVNTGPATPVTQQIAGRIAAEVSSTVAQSTQPDATAFGVKHEPAVKVMHLQLQPVGMGVVTIRMSVKDNALRLDLEVGRGETAQLIQRDRETLSALLRSAGYVIDGLEVRVADPSSVQIQNNQAYLMQGGQQSGSSQPEARSSGGRPQNERGGNAFGNGHGQDEHADHSARSSGVYI